MFSMQELKKYVTGYSSQTWGNPSAKLYFASSSCRRRVIENLLFR
jgi:hypothetical protein